MAREFIVPGQIITGSGALTMAEETLKGLGKKALIVTDKVMIQLGNCAKVETALKIRESTMQFILKSLVSQRIL